jgi:hypothetical protein
LWEAGWTTSMAARSRRWFTAADSIRLTCSRGQTAARIERHASNRCKASTWRIGGAGGWSGGQFPTRRRPIWNNWRVNLVEGDAAKAHGVRPGSATVSWARFAAGKTLGNVKQSREITAQRPFAFGEKRRPGGVRHVNASPTTLRALFLRGLGLSPCNRSSRSFHRARSRKCCARCPSPSCRTCSSLSTRHTLWLRISLHPREE